MQKSVDDNAETHRPSPPQIGGLELRSLQNWGDAIPTSLRGLTLTAGVVLLLVFGIGGAWSATAKLGGALVSSGRVFAEGNNHIIQHLEGGIIQEIAVREGDHVQAGDLLLRLDDTANRSQQNKFYVDRAINVIELARWRAERDTAVAELTVEPAALHPVATHPRVQEALASQVAEYNSSRDSRNQKLLILDGKISNEKQDLIYLEALLQSVDSQKSLIVKEENSYAELLKKGLVRQSQVHTLQRQLAQLDAQRSNALTTIQKSHQNIRSFEDQKREIISSHAEIVSQKITETQKKLNQSEDILTRLDDLIRRSEIKTPISGTIISIPVKSKGAVIKPGDVVAEILPSDADLLMEVPINPDDITKIYKDQDVEIVFPGDDVQIVPPLSGKVTYISADTFTDENKGVSYYNVYVGMTGDQNGREILPGNVAEVFFTTEAKTLIEYLVDPITRFASKTYTE